MRVTPQIICDIIQNALVLDADQIWIYNQRRSIPEDKRMYISVGVLAIKPYGNNTKVEATATGMQDNMAQYIQETLEINIFSYTTEALERYPEILGALRGTYSQQVQEELALKIAVIPSNISDVSDIEGAARLYRIVITLPVLRKYSMLIGASYYDTITPGYIAATE